jgi:hypothetical protein
MGFDRLQVKTDTADRQTRRDGAGDLDKLPAVDIHRYSPFL